MQRTHSTAKSTCSILFTNPSFLSNKKQIKHVKQMIAPNCCSVLCVQESWSSARKTGFVSYIPKFSPHDTQALYCLYCPSLWILQFSYMMLCATHGIWWVSFQLGQRIPLPEPHEVLKIERKWVSTWLQSSPHVWEIAIPKNEKLIMFPQNICPLVDRGDVFEMHYWCIH